MMRSRQNVGVCLAVCTVALLIATPTAVAWITEPLLQVQAVCRHGARAPLASYPADPFSGLQWGAGVANLVPAGVQDQYKLGVDLRRRYHGFLPWRDCTGVTVTSSDRNRTRDSAAALLLGMYSGTRHGRRAPQYLGGPLPDGPSLCPITTIPEERDYTLRLISQERCPALLLGLAALLRTTPEYAVTAPALKVMLARHAGLPDATSQQVVQVFDTLRTQRALGLHLPAWTELPLPNGGGLTTLQAMEQFFRLAFGGLGKPQLRTLSAGVLMRRLLENMSAASPSALELISAHDTTLASLESALGVYDDVLPTSSCLLLETFASSAGRRVRLVRRRGDTGAVQELPLGCAFGRHWCYLRELWQLPWLPRTEEQVKQACAAAVLPSLGNNSTNGRPAVIVY